MSFSSEIWHSSEVGVGEEEEEGEGLLGQGNSFPLLLSQYT